MEVISKMKPPHHPNKGGKQHNDFDQGWSLCDI